MKRRSRIILGVGIAMLSMVIGGFVKTPASMAEVKAAEVANLRTKSSSANTTLYAYATGSTKAGYTNGCYGADAALLQVSGTRARIMIGGQVGWVNTSEIKQLNYASVKNYVSYYVASGGKFYHYVSKSFDAKSSYGINMGTTIPSGIRAGVKYYSYDGHYFYNDYYKMIEDYRKSGCRTQAINASKPFYNYFQFLPLRSTTSYSYNDLNTAINSKTTSSSKMRGLADDLLAAQDKYGVNALIMTGIAANESGWGTSSICSTKNNLFGLNAVDASPGKSANYFTSTGACVKEFAESWMSKKYLRPGYTYYHGAYLGDKASGINYSYASDPYWGEKAAAHIWNMDEKMNYKDRNRYRVGITNATPAGAASVAVKVNAGSIANLTTQKLPNQAFLVLGNATGGWYRAMSDGVKSGNVLNASTGAYSFSMYGYIPTSSVKVWAGTGSATPKASGYVQVGKVGGVKNYYRSKSTLKIKWNKVSGATGYQVYRATAMNGKYKKVKTTSSTSWSDGGQSKGTEYYYKIRAYRKVGSVTTYGSYSSVLRAYTKGATTKTKKTKSAVNTRKYAGTSYAKVKKVGKNQKVTILATTRDKSGAKWYRVKFKKSRKTYNCYIKASLVK